MVMNSIKNHSGLTGTGLLSRYRYMRPRAS